MGIMMRQVDKGLIKTTEIESSLRTGGDILTYAVYTITRIHNTHKNIESGQSISGWVVRLELLTRGPRFDFQADCSKFVGFPLSFDYPFPYTFLYT